MLRVVGKVGLVCRVWGSGELVVVYRVMGSGVELGVVCRARDRCVELRVVYRVWVCLGS